MIFLNQVQNYNYPLIHIIGRDAVFTINFKQLLQEKISIRIVDPRGSVVSHRETEIQTGISR